MEDRKTDPGGQQKSTQQQQRQQKQNDNNNSATTEDRHQVQVNYNDRENDPEKIIRNSPSSNIASTSMALVPYQVEPQTVLHLLHSSPDSLLNYILNLRRTVDQLVDENKSLESANKKLKRCLLQGRCRSRENQVSQQSIVAHPDEEAIIIPLSVAEKDNGNCSAASGRVCLQAAELSSSRDPTSFVSVLAPPPLPSRDQNNKAGPSQNVSSLNITPEATKPNSLAILPPQALPEPRVNSNADEDGGGVETIRSPNVLATEHTGNHTVSSEDISIAVNNSERNSTSRSSEELGHRQCSSNSSQEGEDNINNMCLSLNSTVSTTHIPNNLDNEQPASSTKTNNSPGPSANAVPPCDLYVSLRMTNDVSNLFLSAKSSAGLSESIQSQPSSLTSAQESSTRSTDTANSNAAGSRNHGNIFHPFLSTLRSARRGFLQRVRNGFRSRQDHHPADSDGDDEMVENDYCSPVALSTSWPVSANVAGSTCLSSGLQSSRLGSSCADHATLNSMDEHRPSSLSSLRTQLYFDAQMFEVHQRQLAAGRLPEEPEENGDTEEHQTDVVRDEEDLFRTPLLRAPSQDHAASRDSLHVNIDSSEIIEEDLIDELVTGGDDLAVDESSSSSSSAESADGRGDAGTEPPSSTISLTDQTSMAEQPTTSTAASPVHTTASQQKFGTNLGGKYGNLGVLFRPRPPSGHRYVISANEVSSRRRNETRLPSWVPTYAQRIECILHQVLDEVENPRTATIPAAEFGGPDLNFVYARLRGDPPMRLLEFDQSSDSEDSCIRSINNTSTKHKKSCLKVISREGNVGESRPKNLSWSQHVYVAQIPALPVPYGDHDKNKTRSCPGIYYMGEFKIHNGKSLEDCMGKLEKYGRSNENGFQGIVRRLCHCLRCNSPPPQHVQSTMDVRSGDGLCPNINPAYTCHDATANNSVNVARNNFPRLNFKWRRRKNEGKVYKKQKK